ncbi:MAG TPA: PEP-CTERM sorting domain-containing protein [Rhizomicrobium sp.]|nr:PEP-CTERM sorting domain-containing protein [Rhizomicrobium sp.]
MKKAFFAAAMLVLGAATSVEASPTYLSFGSENGGVPQLNYYGFANFNVSVGSVDLIGNGYFDAYPGNGLYVDLAGSTNQFGAITTKTVYGPGTYDIGLSLGGPIYNGITDGAAVSWGTGSKTFILNGLQEADYNFTVKLTQPEAFTIADMGLSGNTDIGATLFGIQITDPRRGESVPEPLTVSLFGAGLAGAVAMRRRRKKAMAG